MTEKLKDYSKSVLRYIQDYIKIRDIPESIAETMLYAVESGGKRLRPVLCLEFCKLCGGAEQKAMSAAAAIEMIHTFSLVYDDLPCMDDDDLRRGKPSCHIAYGEAFALLGGSALESFGYTAVIDDGALTDSVKIKLLKALSDGVNGMIYGQVCDMSVTANSDEKFLTHTNLLKTGALVSCACKMGCIAAGADEALIEKAGVYGNSLGLAFQITDDILDSGVSDEISYVSLLGLEGAKKKAKEYTEKAVRVLKEFPDAGSSDFLTELTYSLLERKS
ncbi:MAG: polyprenyl synthetase family protein [Oscillospiraceae bacterium]|jgi:geranylgeranyl diphosphate synthase type II|nr:polyprenyl synthetase family protein [Oscillospiraceae bacterium]